MESIGEMFEKFIEQEELIDELAKVLEEYYDLLHSEASLIIISGL